MCESPFSTHLYFIEEELLCIIERLKTFQETDLFNLLNHLAFSINLYTRDYALSHGMSADETEYLLNNVKGCIDGMIKYIPEKLNQLPPKNELK